MRSLSRRLAETEGQRRPWPAEPVRVVLVITELDVGGAERALVNLARGLDRARWEPAVVALGPEGPLCDPLRKVGIPVACLNVKKRRPLAGFLALARAFRAHRPALVQSFLFHANIAARLAAPWAGHPWVVGGLRVAEPRRLHLIVDRLTHRLSAGEVCVSEGVRAHAVKAGGLPEARLAVIPNGIDLDAFDRAAGEAPLRGEGGRPRMLFVGRIDKQKGWPILLDAFERIAPRFPDWALDLVGDGPERDRLVAELGRPGLSGCAEWLGQRGDVPALLASSDLFVLPSLWEGMPNAVLEAMAAGKAVAATAVEGTRELVVSGETGWLVPPRDAGALAAALAEAAGDPARRHRYGMAGRARIEAGFSLRAVIAAYERLWAGLLGLTDPIGRGDAADTIGASGPG
jgi:glycosyltransferase involved in cell wall biosynthesis